MHKTELKICFDNSTDWTILFFILIESILADILNIMLHFSAYMCSYELIALNKHFKTSVVCFLKNSHQNFRVVDLSRMGIFAQWKCKANAQVSEENKKIYGSQLIEIPENWKFVNLYNNHHIIAYICARMKWISCEYICTNTIQHILVNDELRKSIL